MEDSLKFRIFPWGVCRSSYFYAGFEKHGVKKSAAAVFKHFLFYIGRLLFLVGIPHSHYQNCFWL